MLVTVIAHDRVITGRLDAWDDTGVVIDGVRYDGPVFIVPVQR